MIQYNTTNNSFLKMYHILKGFGIQNCTFFLELFDEDLLNVDPFDEELDRVTIVKIHAEIVKNPWYYLREIVRIPTAGTSRRFELTRGSLAICWAILNNLSNFVILPRQSYKTYTVCAMYMWLFYWGAKNTEFMLFSYSDAILQGNLGRIKEIRETLPKFLNLYNPRTDKDNLREMKVVRDTHYNHIRIKSSSTSKEAASKAGRGFSTPCMWIDELCFVANVKEMYESSVYAYKTVSQIARESGSPYHRIMTSSAGRLDTDEGKWSFDFMNSCVPYDEHMLDMDQSTLNECITRNSLNGYISIIFGYQDLNRDDEYLEEMRKDSTSEDAFKREVLNVWMATSENHPLGQDIISSIHNHIHRPCETIVIDEVYFLKLYRPILDINFSKRFLAGVDCGGNLLQDFSTCVIVDPENFEVVGVMRTNSYSTTRFARCLGRLMRDYFPNMVMIPERNSMGIAIIDTLIDFAYGMKSRIYHDMNDKPGFATTKDTRPLLLNNLLRVVVSNDVARLNDVNIINEIIGLKVSRSGRIDHDQNGGHDDTLMAYLFVRWFCQYAKNRDKYVDAVLVGSKSVSEDVDVADKEDTMTSDARKRADLRFLMGDNTFGGMRLDSSGRFSQDVMNPRSRDILPVHEDDEADSAINRMQDIVRVSRMSKLSDVVTIDSDLADETMKDYMREPDVVKRDTSSEGQFVDLRTNELVLKKKAPPPDTSKKPFDPSDWKRRLGIL